MLRLLVIKVSNLEKARQFYSVLGLVFVEEKHGKGPIHYSCILSEQLVFELYPAADDFINNNNVRLGFEVDESRLPLILEQGATLLKQYKSTAANMPFALLQAPDRAKIDLYHSNKKN